MNARIGLIASGETPYMRLIAQHLVEKGCPPAAVFLGSRLERLRQTCQSVVRVWKRHGWCEVFRRRADRRRARREVTRPIQVPPLIELVDASQTRVRSYDRLNSGALLVAIMSERLDVLILAGCGIVSGLLASRPRLGCVNAHPAILPGARGVDVVEWCLLKDHPLGVSAHLVASRVDAGSVLKVLPLQPQPGESFPDFRERVDREQARIAAEGAWELARGCATETPNDLRRSELYFVTTRRDRLAAARIYAQSFGR